MLECARSEYKKKFVLGDVIFYGLFVCYDVVESLFLNLQTND